VVWARRDRDRDIGDRADRGLGTGIGLEPESGWEAVGGVVTVARGENITGTLRTGGAVRSAIRELVEFDHRM
jgi:hypothetical protein